MSEPTDLAFMTSFIAQHISSLLVKVDSAGGLRVGPKPPSLPPSRSRVYGGGNMETKEGGSQGWHGAPQGALQRRPLLFPSHFSRPLDL